MHDVTYLLMTYDPKLDKYIFWPANHMEPMKWVQHKFGAPIILENHTHFLGWGSGSPILFPNKW